MTIIAFSHHKGGTGKTTSCLNIAGFCEKSGKRVLVVDCDPQANATTGLGVIPDSCRQNIYDIFMSRAEGFPQVTMKDIIVKTSSGIDLAPSNLDLVGAEPYLYQIDSRASVLKEALDPVKDSYDLILIDTPPSMGQFVINGLFAADHIIVTLDSGSFALNGISTLTTIFNDMRQDLKKDIHMDMAIISRWNEAGLAELKDKQPEKTDFFSRLKNLFGTTQVISPEEELARFEQEQERERQSVILSDIRSRFSAVFTVPYSPEIYDAQKRGMPISHVAPASSAGQAYRTITDEVLTWK
ncbi:MAG: AAA family ATPase [Methanoregula sp.]|jgi:chromosome partitioning protein